MSAQRLAALADPAEVQPQDLSLEFRSVRIGMHVTLLAPLLAASVFVMVGSAGSKIRPYGPAFVTVAVAAAIVTMLPLPASRWGTRLGYAWLSVDILLFTLGWVPSGRTGLLFVYALTTTFFAISFPRSAQAFLFTCTVGSYGLVYGIGRSDALPIFALGVLAYLANFLTREAREQMVAYRQAHFESERRWTLAATVSAAARNMTPADPRGVLTAVVDSIIHLGYERARLYIRQQPDGDWEVLLPGREFESGNAADCLPQTIQRAVLGEGRSVIVRRGHADLATGRALDDLGLQSIVAVPIRAQDQAEAIMVVGASGPWDPSLRDIEAFRMLAAQAGLAIENARRFEDQRRTAERMAELDRLKRDFLSTVSHELRTPLTVISGMGLTLERQWTTLDDEIRLELLARLNANAQTLESIITRLLDFSRLEAGRLEVQAEDVDVPVLVDGLVRRLEALTSGHALAIDIEPGLSVKADPVLLERIFENLLSNAIKYTPRGSHIRFSAGAEGDEAILAVEDDGPAIPQDDLPHLGEQFFRGGDAQTRTTRGTGLGLSLVSEILRLHGSQLHVDSRLGEGASFSFRLQAVAPARPKAGYGDASEPPHGSARPVEAASTRVSEWDEDVIQGERFATVLAAAQMGTDWAVGMLFRELNPRILRYLRAHGVPNPDAVATQVWREMMGGIGFFEGDFRTFRAWIFGGARRAVLDARMLSSNDERAGGDGSPLDLSGWETDQRRVGAESIQQSLARLAALPEEQAEVVLLRVLGRLTPLDVADIIGTPPATVRGLEQDGLQRLRRGPALAAVKSGHAEG